MSLKIPLHFKVCRCVSLPVVSRLQNDLYCVGWGVKHYSLTTSGVGRGLRGAPKTRANCAFLRYLTIRDAL